MHPTAGGGGQTDPAGFEVQEFHIPAGGFIISPFGGPGTPPTFQVYMLCTNGSCTVCSTDLPANPCATGYQLNQGVAYLGPVSGLALDLTKSNIEFTNNTGQDVTLRVGVPI